MLCATSNLDADQVQRASVAGTTLPALVAEFARLRTGDSYTVGVVVGATRGLADIGLTAADLDGLLVLAPGFGAQGASLTDISNIYGAAKNLIIPSVSRSVVCDGLANMPRSIEQHLRELGF
jgi:orotidine-5'-phosphate decarboxylase